MPIIGTSFTWTAIPAGIWTRFAQGPLIDGAPLQSLELVLTGPPSGSVTFTLDGYSAAPPFYERDTGVFSTFFLTSPPVGQSFIPAALLSYRVSPYVEFWLLVSRPCWAHISMF